MRGLVWSVALVGVVLSAQLRAREGVVYTVNYPLADFAEAIAGPDLTVVFPAPPGEDPAYWQPDTEILLAFQRADLILLNGAGYAKWIAAAVLPRGRMVDTSAAAGARLIAAEGDTVAHVHGPEGDRVHAHDTAFTTWLDLSLARAQASAVLAAMTVRWPDMTDELTQRHAALDARLAALDTALETAARAHAGKPLLASHPVYQYLARRYRLDIASLHWEPGIDPGEPEWQALETLLRTHPAKTMLWEGKPAPSTRERLASMGIAVVVFPTLANRPREGSFIDIMTESAARLGRP